MCNLSKGITEESFAEGFAEGFAKVSLDAIRNVMDKFKMTTEQAMEILEVSKDDYT